MTVIQGIVEHGDERGRTLGFPTANIQLFDDQIEDGVRAAMIRTDSGKCWVAAVSTGRRQTFMPRREASCSKPTSLTSMKTSTGRS